MNHPLRTFLEKGILATINTDDPGISDIDLNYEYEIAAPAAGLSKSADHPGPKERIGYCFLE